MSDIEKVGLTLAIAIGVPSLVVILEGLAMLAAREIATQPTRPRETYYDRSLAAGIPHIVGVVAVFEGLGADIAIALRADDLRDFSPVIDESVILFSILALIGGFIVAGLTAYLVIRVLLKEIPARLDLMMRRASNPPQRRFVSLARSQEKRLRLAILSLGVFAISIPASVTFLRL